MNAKEFLNNVSKEIKYKPANKLISEELEAHIEELKKDNLCKGFSEEQAEELAVEQMGDATKIGKRLNKIHRPKLDWVTLILTIILILWGGGYYKLCYPDVFVGKGFAGLNDFITNKIEYIVYIFVMLFSIFLYFYDYRKISKHSKIFYIIATSLNIIAYFRGFRANGNLIYGLWPFVAISPSAFTVPLYIIAFSGFMNDINKESKIKITISNQKIINPNVIKIAGLAIISVITSLMISFVSGFLVATVYIIMSIREFIKAKNNKNTIIFTVSSIFLFSLLALMICIVPLKWDMMDYNEPTSAYWVGVETKGEKRKDFLREELFKSAKLFGKADLQNTPIENEYGFFYDISRSFYPRGDFAFLGMVARYGWVAGLGVVGLLLLFNIKLIINAIKMKDRYGKLLVIGIASLYIVQTVCNLLMNLGIIGVAEFNLPFISGGDIEWLMNIMCMSLVLSIYRRKDINFEEPKKSKLLTKIEDFFFEEVEEGVEVTNAYK